MRKHLWTSVALLLLWAAPARPAEWFVAAGASGDGRRAAPFGRVQQALDAAAAGDTITVASGEYRESLTTIRSGDAARPIVLRAAGARGSTIVTFPGRVLTVRHEHIVIDGLVLDGQYGRDNVVRVTSDGSWLVLRNTEVRRSSRDTIDMAAPTDVLIENCLVHHALNPSGGRTDAHGIALSAARRLTIRNTDIHTFSGDGIQIDPARASPGWTDVTIEHCRIWLEPLKTGENGFPAGSVPGENAVDTKANRAYPRARITIADTVAWGFRHGMIQNMAAFNLKENIEAILDGVTVHDSEIAFRLRGPGPNNGAHIRLMNSVVYDVNAAIRYEDNIERLEVWNCTIGGGVQRAFVAASSRRDGLDVKNVLVLGPALPPEAAAPSNRAVGASAFIDAGAHDYRLRAGSPAIDAGVALPEVRHDRAGTSRPQGRAYDAGAYEWSREGAR